jgi:hypothetical protein
MSFPIGIGMVVFHLHYLLAPFVDKGELKPPTILANAASAEDRVLTLWKCDLPYARRLDYLRGPELRGGGEQDGLQMGAPMGDVAFVLVDSPQGKPGEGKVLWVNYFVQRWFCPGPKPSMDVVWHAQRKRIYVVTAVSERNKVLLRAEEIDPQKRPIAKLPLRFNNHKRAEWPQDALQLNLYRPQFEKECTDWASNVDYDGVKQIKVVVEKDSLLVVAEREDLKCPTLCFRYHLDKKTWSELRLQEIDPRKKD